MRTIDGIYLRPASNDQEGHEVFDLHTKAVKDCGKIWVVPVTQTVIDRVNSIGKADGFKDLVFSDKFGNLYDDCIAGVDDDDNDDQNDNENNEEENVIEQQGENEDDEEDYEQEESDDEEDVEADEEITEEEIDDITREPVSNTTIDEQEEQEVEGEDEEIEVQEAVSDEKGAWDCLVD